MQRQKPRIKAVDRGSAPARRGAPRLQPRPSAQVRLQARAGRPAIADNFIFRDCWDTKGGGLSNHTVLGY